MALANMIGVVRQVNEHYPGLITRDPHAFTNAVAYTLWLTDNAWGHNVKRGSQGLSEDAICKVDDASPLKARNGRGIYIIDIIGSAGSPNASPAWIDQTQATLNKGETGAWSQPKQPGGPLIDLPAPGVDPTPNPPAVVTCPCESDIAGVYEALSKVIMLVQSLADRNEQLHKTTVGHVDDAKGRIERVSQELANKPTPAGCRLRF
jgi:hypothetical protein